MAEQEIGGWLSREAPTEHLTQLEGVPLHGEVVARIAARTPTMLVLDVRMSAGARSAPHTHESDSAGILIAGQVRAVVDGVATVLGAGDGFHHPQGVIHHVQAIEDSRWVEIKSPPIDPW